MSSKKTSKKVVTFQPGSFRAKALKALESGKPMTSDQLVNRIGAKKALGKSRTSAAFVLPIMKDFQKAGHAVQKTDAGWVLKLRKKAA